MNRDEIPQRRRARKADSREVDDQFRAAPILQMGVIRRTQILDGGRSEPETVPELRDQDSVDVVGLERGLQHPSPAAGSRRDGHVKHRSPEYRSMKQYGQAGRSISQCSFRAKVALSKSLLPRS